MFSARYNPESAVADDEMTNSNKLNKFPFKRKREESSESDSSSSSDSEVEEIASDIDEIDDILEIEKDEQMSVDEKVEDKRENEAADSSIDSSKYFTPQPEPLEDNKHNSILERFKQTINLQESLLEKADTENEDEAQDDTPMHDLIPIPQPSKVYLPKVRGSFLNESWSHLNKIYYDLNEQKEWAMFHSEKLINDVLYDNLRNNLKFDIAMPVQTTIMRNYLPMLLKNYSISKSNYTSKSGDVLINSFTGSGKTLAYLIPILQILMNRKLGKLRCVIVLPTTILIQQVYTTIIQLCKSSDLVVATSKPNSMSLKEEIEKFRSLEMDILISTPGRLVDHLNSKSVNFKDLKFLVMDESDKLLNQSYQDWVNVVMQAIEGVPATKFVVSATLTKNTEKLELLKLNPIRTNLFLLKDEEGDTGNTQDSIYQLPKGLQEYSMKLRFKDSLYKPFYLTKLLNLIHSKPIENNVNHRILVFVNSNQSALRLTPLLGKLVSQFSDDINVYSINTNNTNLQNKQYLEKFNENNQNKSNVLIATDVMSRGMDLLISDVINYNLPISSQQYVHRIGRTGRGVNKSIGNVYNIFVGNDDYKYYSKQIDRYLKRFSNSDSSYRTLVEHIEKNLRDISESIDEKSSAALTYKSILKEFTK